MQRWDLLRNIKLAYGIGGEERHPHFKKGRDENLECTWPPAPWLSNSFKMHDLASSLDPFSAFRIALSWQKSTPHLQTACLFFMGALEIDLHILVQFQL